MCERMSTVTGKAQSVVGRAGDRHDPATLVAFAPSRGWSDRRDRRAVAVVERRGDVEHET
jgi:hypothetical protein